MTDKSKKHEKHEKKHNKHAHKEITKKHLGGIQGGSGDPSDFLGAPGGSQQTKFRPK